MSDSQRDCGIVALVIDLLDDATSPARAACGLPAPFLLLFGMTHKLGRLDRGETVCFDAVECQLLYEILEAAGELESAGKMPIRSDEVIATMLTRVAFDNVAPAAWGRHLYRARTFNQGWKVSGGSRRQKDL